MTAGPSIPSIRWRAAAASLACAVSLLLTSCGSSDPATLRSTLTHDCALPRLAQTVRCGSIEVPENRGVPRGRQIRIAFSILPANTLNPAADPLVLLAGGPGQAASYLGPLAARFNAVRRYRDIVLIDQRGTGNSSPLKCDAFVPPDTLDGALELDPVPRATRCARELASQGVDAAQYTTAAWIEDIEAVRSALGYEVLNLWGGSYGTRVAQEYVRRHPQRVRSMILDGVAPPSLNVAVDVWRTREAAIEAVFDDCARVPACAAGHPGYRGAIAALDERLSGGRAVTVVDPRTGQSRELRISLPLVLAAFQGLAYVPELAALLPEATRLATEGEFGPLLAAAASINSGILEQINSALYYSVTCAEDVPRIGPAERDALGAMLARSIAERGIAVCDAWPRGSAPADAATPLTSDVPTLVLSGGLDPVTPPAYGDRVAKTLRNSRHVVAKGFGHNVSPHACAPRLIAAFIEDPAFGKMPEACVRFLEQTTRPPFWPDRLAPAS